MRGINTQKSKIRNTIFKEIANLAYTGGGTKQLEEIPYRIIPGEIAKYRDSVFLERAVIGERLRAAMGLEVRLADDPDPISEGMESSMIDEKYYEPPLIDVIRFACNRCPDDRIFITDACQGCLEHPCIEVCPMEAISMKHGRSVIDEEKCIKCGKCKEVCPYSAIIFQDRPCEIACGLGAIRADENGIAVINPEKCVSCGQCLVSCPFGAIVDKGQIYQTIQAIKEGEPVVAIIAPSAVGQFGSEVTYRNIRAAFKALGFYDVEEVAVGADLCTLQEAEDFLKEVPDVIPFMGTSCCPSWAKMVRNEFPEQAKCISMALTPMVLTARLIKTKMPEAKICFIGPCASKKLEASRETVKSYVDFVLTYEEVQGMFDAKEIDFRSLPEDAPLDSASGDGRGFATSGGVAQAVVNLIKEKDPEREVNVVSAEGLDNCKKLMLMAKAGRYNGFLLEGMACPGGCIGGAGT
ncbi:MAG: 4Fe-4S dicluster domain-containing protein, partial [Clostridia bacterium]|nr:4Fe-4S dicluster domain-containing protein [Clostridia bacterium]